MTGRSEISVLIDNYNYARYLGEAIESALAQGDGIEIVVIDDGSTDDSAAVAETFGDRIRWLTKPNGGQGSAFNAGLAEVTGRFVTLLDADDRLVGGAIDRIAETVRARPDVAMVVHRLELIDADGRSMGATLPGAGADLPSGDLRSRLLASPDDIPWQPTSGMTLRLEAARRVLPVPERTFRVCADAYLANMVGLLGPVASIDRIGAQYRIHDANAHYRSSFDLERIRATIIRTDATHDGLRRLAAESGHSGDELKLLSVTDQASRLLVRRLGAGSPPAEEPTYRYVIDGLRASASRRDRSLGDRAAMFGWFLTAAAAPKRWLPRLAGLALRR